MDANEQLRQVLQEGRRKTVTILVIGGIGMAFLVVVAVVMVLGGKKGAPEVAEPVEEAPPVVSAALTRLQAVVEEKPCNKAAVDELAGELNKAERYAETVALTKRFRENCGEYPLLLWKTYYAHEQLGEWAEAAKVATTLIQDEPGDGDFWWWRGKARAADGRIAGAVADFRQAIAGLPASDSNGIPVMKLAEMAEIAGVTCDAAALLRLFIVANEDEVYQSTIDRQARLHLKGECERSYGEGRAILRLDPVRPKNEVKVTVGSATGTFLLSPRSGYTVLTRAFAEKTGVVTLAGEVIETYAAGSVQAGLQAEAERIAVQGASAPAVRVILVDALPGGLDGALGMSFLARFEYDDAAEDDLTLVPWSERDGAR